MLESLQRTVYGNLSSSVSGFYSYSYYFDIGPSTAAQFFTCRLSLLSYIFKLMLLGIDG